MQAGELVRINAHTTKYHTHSCRAVIYGDRQRLTNKHDAVNECMGLKHHDLALDINAL